MAVPITSRSFSRIYVLCNPVSTNAGQGQQRILELQEFFGKQRVTVIETVSGGSEANRQLICKYAKRFDSSTLLCIAAGDGTVGMVVETLVQDPRIPEKARATPILPLWGGNANDLAHMLNGNGYRSRLHEVLTKGSVIAVHPIECTLTSEGKQPVTRIAACYASFGATAFAAARLNEPEVRRSNWRRIPGGRFIAEVLAGAHALLSAPSFALQEGDGSKLIYERTFANGSRFAKVERLPLKLTEHAFLKHTVEKDGLHMLLPRLWRFLQKARAPQYKESYTEFTIQEPVMAQFDGEPMEVAANTKVCVTLSKQPFYALSVVLPAEE